MTVTSNGRTIVILFLFSFTGAEQELMVIFCEPKAPYLGRIPLLKTSIMSPKESL